jgi:hypothetical protein
LNPSKGKRLSSPPQRPGHLWGTSDLLLNGYRDSLLSVKWPGREVDQSPLFSAEVKNEWSYTAISPMFLPGMEGKLCLFVIIIIIIIIIQ